MNAELQKQECLATLSALFKIRPHLKALWREVEKTDAADLVRRWGLISPMVMAGHMPTAMALCVLADVDPRTYVLEGGHSITSAIRALQSPPVPV